MSARVHNGGEQCDTRGCDGRGTEVRYPDGSSVPKLVCGACAGVTGSESGGDGS